MADDDKDRDEHDDDGDEGEEASTSATDDRDDDDVASATPSVPASDDEDDEDDEPEDEERIARREAAQIEREDRELAEGSEHDVAPISSVLGIERWVQFAFIALAVATFYVSDKLITFVWSQFAEPDTTLVSGVAALLGIVGAFVLYRHPRVNELAHEVVGELSKVTWPSRDETYYSTVVVIVTSVIAALYCGIFDALWSAFTDLIYNV
jgi:preprotein translocase SecE subunit